VLERSSMRVHRGTWLGKNNYFPDKYKQKIKYILFNFELNTFDFFFVYIQDMRVFMIVTSNLFHLMVH
jgi:hypothetical protein